MYLVYMHIFNMIQSLTFDYINRNQIQSTHIRGLRAKYSTCCIEKYMKISETVE